MTLGGAAILAAPLAAQQRSVRIVTADSVPVPFAWVAIQGQSARIADERGILLLGDLPARSYAVDVRRIGYAPFAASISVGDTPALVRLTPVAAQLGKAAALGTGPMSMAGFYRRWLKRQNGGGAGVFIGPEEIEKRNVTDIGALLRDQNGIRLERATDGGFVLVGSGGTDCRVAIMLDGQLVRSPAEAREGTAGKNGLGTAMSDAQMSMDTAAKDASNGRLSASVGRKRSSFNSANSIKVDQLVAIDAVVGVEVYGRTGSLPADLNLADNSCGLVVLWTGVRK